MLTENRRLYLKERSSEKDKKKRAEMDYRLLKWLQVILDSGDSGGIGDINRVLDTLDADSVRKYLKADNVYSLLNLTLRLMDLLDFGAYETLARGPSVVATKRGVRSGTEEDFYRNLSLNIYGHFLAEYYTDLRQLKQSDGRPVFQSLKILSRFGYIKEDAIEKFIKDMSLAE